MAAIKPARLLSQRAHILPGKLLVTELFFEVPKSYSRPELGSLKLFGRSVRKHERPIIPLSRPEQEAAASRIPYLIFLEGGPGFGNRDPQESPITNYMLNRGYQVLFLDYRGTGLSTPISASHLRELGSPQKQADYLKLFRADSIVRDCEAVRQCLTADFPEDKKKWSLFGQSFGGFVSLTYLSKFPQALQEVFMTGGLAPIGRTPEEVYRALWKKVVERNEAYYAKFPEDTRNVKRLVTHIVEKNKDGSGGIPLPSGGFLTITRLLSLGLSFGAHGGLDSVHSLILKLVTDIDQFGYLTRAALASLEQNIPFDTNPVYAILHEPIYCFKRGVASRWAAHEVGRETLDVRKFGWLSSSSSSSQTTDDGEFLSHIDGQDLASVDEREESVPYFSGEMVFPAHFEGTYPELSSMREAAHILAHFDGWEDDLYDEEQLRRNEVPVYAASFVDDMYVDFELARRTARLVKNCQVWETNGMYHSAIRARTDEVLGQLFRMRDDTID